LLARSVNLSHAEVETMRTLLALAVTIYLVGVGVELSPTIRTQWNSAPAPEFATNVAVELPKALAWPAMGFQGASERDRSQT
jgi:hypothetical protein